MIPAGSAVAAVKSSDPAPQPIAIEVVVYETTDCLYCFLFRRDVAPGYRRSRRGQSVPLRYLNLDEATPSRGLKAPISQVPTAVVMREGHEIGRIEGYTGPHSFYQAIARLFATLTQPRD